MEYIRIQEILFAGRQRIDWDAVELYLKRFSGRTVVIREYGDKIIINNTFAEEFAESRYTKHLRGALAKAKANVVQELPRLIETAQNRRWIENKDPKHKDNASKGWYRYDVRFMLPVKAENESEIRWNRYRGTMVVRINNRGLFLYDIIDIKKEARTPEGSHK